MIDGLELDTITLFLGCFLVIECERAQVKLDVLDWHPSLFAFQLHLHFDISQ